MSRPLIVSDALAEPSKSGRTEVIPGTFVEIPQPKRERSKGVVDVWLPARFFLKRTIALPKAARRNASKTVELDMMRRTPFRPADVFGILSPISRRGEDFEVSQWLVERTEVNQIRSNLASRGYQLRRLHLHAEGALRPVVDFSDDIAPRAKMWRRLNAALAVIAIAAFSFAFVQPVLKTKQNTAQVKTQVDALQTEALDLRQTIDVKRATEDEKAAFLDLLLRRPKLSDTIRELTVTVPDDTWLESVTFRQERLVFAGMTSGSAAGLVLGLADARSFENPRMSGPTSRTANGQERFEITLDIGTDQ